MHLMLLKLRHKLFKPELGKLSFIEEYKAEKVTLLLQSTIVIPNSP